jgi:hypothetical protein
VRLQIAAPALHAARVRLFDETGSPITTAFLRRGSSGGNTPMPMRAPEWATPRNPLPPDLALGRSGGWRRMLSGGGERRVEAGPDGAFELGSIRGTGRLQMWSVSWSLRPEGRTVVRADFRSEDAEKGDLVGVSVPVARFDEVVVRLPDGRLARDAGATLDFASSAVAVPADARPTAWRTIPVRLTVRLSGYEDLTVEWRVGDPLPGPLTMKPVPPKQE